MLADGAEGNPGKCLYGGASLGGGTVEERPETPVELQTKVRAAGHDGTKAGAAVLCELRSETLA